MIRRMAGCMDVVERPSITSDLIAMAQYPVRYEAKVYKRFSRRTRRLRTTLLTCLAEGEHRRFGMLLERRNAVSVVAMGVSNQDM